MSNNKSVSTILAILSGVGVVGTAALAIKATPEACSIVDDLVYDQYLEHVETTEDEQGYWEWLSVKCDGDKGQSFIGRAKLCTKKEIIQATWKCYIPAAAVCLGTLACIAGGTILNKQSQASLAGAYALVSESYKRFRKSTKKIFGEDAEEKVDMNTSYESFESDKMAKEISLGNEEILCYDVHSHRYFPSTKARVYEAQHILNDFFRQNEVVTLNEYFGLLGIDFIKGGDDILWCKREDSDEIINFENIYVTLEDDLTCFIISPMYRI